MAKAYMRIRATLTFPDHQFKPEDILHFVETSTFTESWSGFGLDDSIDLTELQFHIMAEPRSGTVIPGTGGMRKLRFSPSSWSVGKRSALRVCYVFFEQFSIVLLLLVYAKSDQDNLSIADKKACKRLIEVSEKHLESGYVKFRPNP